MHAIESGLLCPKCRKAQLITKHRVHNEGKPDQKIIPFFECPECGEQWDALWGDNVIIINEP